MNLKQRMYNIGAMTLSIFFALTLAVSLCAGSAITCPPVLTPDKQTVTPGCAGLGERVYAFPDSTYEVWWNDQKITDPVDDFDFSDLVAQVSTNALGVTTIEWIGENAAFDNSMWFGFTFLFSNSYHPGPVVLGAFAPGTELAFSLLTPEFKVWHTGPGVGNSDGAIHAWVTGGPNAVETPEPLTMILIGGGLLALAGLARVLRHEA